MYSFLVDGCKVKAIIFIKTQHEQPILIRITNFRDIKWKTKAYLQILKSQGTFYKF